MYELTNWYLSKIGEGRLRASGYCWNNPKFSQGYAINTSYIEKLGILENGLLIITHSGSQYLLRYNQINIRDVDYTKECIPNMGLTNDLIRKCVTAAKKWETNYLNELDTQLQPSSLYVEVASVTTVFAAFKIKDKMVKRVPISVHVSSFGSDSILVTDFQNGIVDFRYFPMGIAQPIMEPYHWSDNIEQLVLKNVGNEDIIFKNWGNEKNCKVGEVTVLAKKDFYAEGLFSPDVYNGKSIVRSDVEEQ